MTRMEIRAARGVKDGAVTEAAAMAAPEPADSQDIRKRDPFSVNQPNREAPAELRGLTDAARGASLDRDRPDFLGMPWLARRP